MHGRQAEAETADGWTDATDRREKRPKRSGGERMGIGMGRRVIEFAGNGMMEANKIEDFRTARPTRTMAMQPGFP